MTSFRRQIIMLDVNDKIEQHNEAVGGDFDE